ncbi:hypothetical protein BHE74_00001771 [Ensete ventricosum]|nr:hypothetical protein BHE74_00001771 [Ensete ventricosum]
MNSKISIHPFLGRPLFSSVDSIVFFFLLFLDFLMDRCHLLRRSDYLFKLLLIGDSSVGKSCLLVRFAKCGLSFSSLLCVYISIDADADADADGLWVFLLRMIRTLIATSAPLVLIS